LLGDDRDVKMHVEFIFRKRCLKGALADQAVKFKILKELGVDFQIDLGVNGLKLLA
jgi:hypothetical protein